MWYSCRLLVEHCIVVGSTHCNIVGETLYTCWWNTLCHCWLSIVYSLVEWMVPLLAEYIAVIIVGGMDRTICWWDTLHYYKCWLNTMHHCLWNIFHHYLWRWYMHCTITNTVKQVSVHYAHFQWRLLLMSLNMSMWSSKRREGFGISSWKLYYNVAVRNIYFNIVPYFQKLYDTGATSLSACIINCVYLSFADKTSFQSTVLSQQCFNN